VSEKKDCSGKCIGDLDNWIFSGYIRVKGENIHEKSRVEAVVPGVAAAVVDRMFRGQ